MKRLQGKKPFWIWVSTQFNAKICDEKFAIQNIRSFEIFEVIMFNNQKNRQGAIFVFYMRQIFWSNFKEIQPKECNFSKKSLLLSDTCRNTFMDIVAFCPLLVTYM